jgi:hypothetical protein
MFVNVQPAQDLQIIGQTRLREMSILFTTSQYNNLWSTTPSTSRGASQIWKVEWDNQNVPTIELVRNANDNFDTEHDIEARGRYELPQVQRVYYTDDLNPLRTLNIFSDSSFMDRVDINPDVKFDIPVVQKLNQQGGTLPTGWYTYAYRYKNLGGSETNFSRFSQPFPIMTADEETEKYLAFTSNASESPTTKSLELKIDNIDVNFQYVDIIVGQMDSLNSIPIYTYVEENVPLSGSNSLTFVHSDIDDAATLSEAEVSIIDTIFTRCKTISIKDNRLLAGNLKDDVVDISDIYDAESYRHYANSTLLKPQYANFTNIINPFNKDSTSYGSYKPEALQNKYQKGGTTIGGTGANIDFKFVTRTLTLDDSATKGILDKSAKVTVGTKALDTTRDGKALPLGGNKIWDNFKNPFIASHFRGYMRSEVYRFGIVFFDKSGRSLDVKWIADIRMPEHGDSGFESYSMNGATLEGKALGVEFTVTIPPNIRDIVSGFSIVRAERKSSDETIIAQGLLGDVSYLNINRDDRPNPPNLTAYTYKMDRTAGYSSNASITTVGTYGRDTQGDYQPFMEDLHTMLSPQLLISDRSRNVSGYKIRPIAAIQPEGFGFTNSNWDIATIPSHYAWYYKFYGSTPFEYFTNVNGANNQHSLSISINDSTYLPGMDENVPNLGDRMTGSPFDDPFINSNDGGFINYTSPVKDFGSRDYTQGTAQMQFGGRGGHCHFLNVEGSEWEDVMCTESNGSTKIKTPTNNSRILRASFYDKGASGAPYYGKLHRKTDALVASAYTPAASLKLLFNLYKELPNQYGGDTASDVQRTEYISTGHYQAIDSSSSSTITATVYGGDTYVNVYDQMTDHVNDNSSGAGGPGTGFAAFRFHETNSSSTNYNGQGVATLFPVESRINLDWRQGIHYSTVGNGNFTSVNLVNFTNNLDSLDTTNVGGITESWERRDNNHIKMFSKSTFSITTSEWDNRVWASDPKINGESSDSWRAFRVNNYLDVDGNLGAINKLETFNDTVYYFQDRAFGKLIVNPNPIIQGSDDIAMALGQGGKVLHDNTYISTNIGTKHQWSVFTSPRHLYWFDIVNKKPYKFGGGGVSELSDVKGMHSFFVDNVDNSLLNLDTPADRRGIRGVYDELNNEALFTFLRPKTTYDNSYRTFFQYSSTIPNGIIEERSLITLSESKNILDDSGNILDTISAEVSYDVIKEFPIDLVNQELIPTAYQTPEYLKARPTYLGRDFTLAFSEVVDAWGAFYDFTPTIYVDTKSRLLTPNPNDFNRVHLHNVGSYNKWYGDDFKTHLEVVSIIGEDATKVYDNLNWHTTANSKGGAGGKDFDQLTFDKYYAYNDYQHTGDIILEPAATNPLLRRVEREWQMAVPRNVVTETGSNVDVLNPANWDLTRTFNDRIRDKYLIQHFEYDNSTSDKFTIDYLHTTVRVSKR